MGPRARQVVFIFLLLMFCWFLMMAFHELGHVVGAWSTGGEVRKLVLNPLTISRTEVDPNPRPGTVVWMGPILGSILPAFISAVVPRKIVALKKTCNFFAGFCLIANGAYISFGVIDEVGDCRQMLQTGSPTWLLVLFGLLSIPTGLWLWHRLGSVKEFLRDPTAIPDFLTWTIGVLLALYLAAAFAFSPV